MSDCTLAEAHLGVEQGFELLLDQARLYGAGFTVVTEEACKSFGAAAVAHHCGTKLVGLKADNALRRQSDIDRTALLRSCPA